MSIGDIKKAQVALLEDLVNGWLTADTFRIPAIRDSQDFKGDLISWCFPPQEKIMCSYSTWKEKTVFQLDSNGVESSEAVLLLDS